MATKSSLTHSFSRKKVKVNSSLTEAIEKDIFVSNFFFSLFILPMICCQKSKFQTIDTLNFRERKQVENVKYCRLFFWIIIFLDSHIFPLLCTRFIMDSTSWKIKKTILPLSYSSGMAVHIFKVFTHFSHFYKKSLLNVDCRYIYSDISKKKQW